MILPLACVCAMGATARAVTQEDVRVQVPLHYVAFKNAHEMIRLTAGGTRIVSRRLPSFEGYAYPVDVPSPMLFKLQIEAFDKPIAAFFGTTTPSRKTGSKLGRYVPTSFSELYLDHDGDQHFSYERFAAKAVDGFNVFGPIANEVVDGSDLLGFYIITRYTSVAGVAPAGYYEGEARLGDKTVKIGLVDANVDGILGERASMSPYGSNSGDVMLIDYNGNGRFDFGDMDALTRGVTSEVRPIAWLMQMPDRLFYHVRVNEGSTSATLERSSVEMGAVAAKCSKMALTMDGPDGQIVNFPQENPLALPPGGYRVRHAVLFAPDRDGKDWMVGVAGEELSRLVRVRSGKTVDLACGGALKASLDASRLSDTYYVSMPITDGFGNGVTGLVRPDGTRPVAPKLKIVDGAGKTVFSQSFSYG